MPFSTSLVLDFFISLGMVVGGSLLGGVAASLMHQPPMATMVRLAVQLKIWALVSTLGGTMDTLRAIETGVLGRRIEPIGKQFALLVSAFIGCQIGYSIIRWLAGGEQG